jgi:tRNA_anti-like
MTFKKKFLIGVPLIICVALGIVYYEYNKPAEDVINLKAQPVTAVDLFKDYTSDESKANISYLNKALQVSGKVLEVKHTQNKQLQIILDSGDPVFGIACTMDNAQKNIKPGEQVTIKGICTGYLNDVVIIKSLLLN